MSAQPMPERFPRGALVGAALVIGAVLLLTTVVRLSGIDISSLPSPRIVEQRELTFADRSDGAVLVYEAGHAAPLAILAPGTNGFLRVVMRDLVHERRQHGIGAATPFRLEAGADGRLILEDPTIGRRIELEAFGPTNAAVFAQFLGESP